MDGIRSRLSGLGRLSARVAASESAILNGAEQRLAVVTSDLAKLRPRALIQEDAGAQYQDLIEERGRLVLVIARARQALGQ